MMKARSTIEMRFAISLETCPRCGTTVDPSRLALEGGGTAWAYTGTCGRCRSPLAFTFATEGDPLTAPVARGQLGDERPSQIIRPGQLVAELDRLALLVRPDPAQLGIADWKASRDANERALVCLAELAKFVPEGAPEIPDDVLAPDERDDRARRREHYTRAWLDEARARHLDVRARVLADLPRIEALEEAGDTTPPQVELDRAAMKAHEAWVARGRTGAGRMSIANARARGERIGAAEMSGAHLADADFVEADLAYVRLDGAELERADCSGANLTGASFRGATVRGGSFAAAALGLAKLERAVVEGTAFDGADLDRSQWQGASVDGASFEDARFGNAVLDGAVFVRCSFLGADLSPTTAGPTATTRGARFEDCDLRDTHWAARDLAGAQFVRCKMDGISGTPGSIVDIEIVEPDLSEGGDGSDIAEADDVLALWS